MILEFLQPPSMNLLANHAVSKALNTGVRPWRGLIPVLNTPFHPEGNIDGRSLVKLCEYAAAARVPAVMLLGVASEATQLSTAERDLIITTVAVASQSRFDVIADISDCSVDDFAQRVNHLTQLGVSAVNWRPHPELNADQIVSVLRLIASTSDLEIMLQDFDLYGTGLADATILRAITDCPSLTAVKVEVSNSVEKINRLRKSGSRTVTFCSGWPIEQFLVALTTGADVSMSTSLSPLLSHLVQLLQTNNTTLAFKTFSTLQPLFSAMTENLSSSIRLNKELRLAEGVFETSTCRLKTASSYHVSQLSHDMVRADVELQESVCGWTPMW